ncbi:MULTISPECIES: GTPase ObgE [Dyadobacter]|jgi:GTP-binding protein|uniref:GTPase Obg n=1 Tax=Dyadobacter chenhuakuii TaxID=2909339 RepID=A0ABY4XHD6_9BACT|nr:MULTISPECIES: GTPase ObgE [Dyadobacter]MCE7068926.1 GTPase ObgE [Dyadobacter sp. CY327]MCF2495536.1 GTPase ObgE [Dyadobacter chenhuakuii]USJ29573.1 GTPase ObgE [Dyadobacter chenhuakuii]
MASSNFIDYVKINVRSGSGGAGSLHFRREKHVEKGGPDGGDGGRGGHVILKGNSQLWTLLHLKYTKHIKAFDGKGGEGGRRSGSIGKDIILEVPLGTIAKNAETGEQLFEITEDGQEVILLKGGRGGMGNDHFKSATNQTPQHAQTGEAGLEAWIILELKVLADVGLVGFPNAGKSTLLSVVSAARPEIADYPFTTLVPNLGVVSYRDYKSFVMADIPGIIEGASQGKGLGLRFLRHIERNSILLFMVPADSEDINAEYETLLQELRIYNPSLLDKSRILAISKTDVLSEEERADLKSQIPASIPSIFISAITQEGIEQLKDQIWNLINLPLSVK